jgi:small-conductance mechanosensitive channel
MDSATLVPILGFAGTVVVAVGAIVVAVITHGSETKATGDNTAERVLEQRILLKDEQNAELKQDLIECMERGRRKDEDNRRLRTENQELRAKLGSQEGS